MERVCSFGHIGARYTFLFRRSVFSICLSFIHKMKKQIQHFLQALELGPTTCPEAFARSPEPLNPPGIHCRVEDHRIADRRGSLRARHDLRMCSSGRWPVWRLWRCPDEGSVKCQVSPQRLPRTAIEESSSPPLHRRSSRSRGHA